MSLLVKRAFTVVVGLLIFVVVFWQFLISTAGWILASTTLPDTAANNARLEGLYELPTVNGTNTTPFVDLILPEPFVRTTIQNETEDILILKDIDSQAFYLAAPMPAFADTIFNNPAYTREENELVCEQMVNVFERSPCVSNDDFLYALFSSSCDSAHFFSSAMRKNTIMTFLVLRNAYLPDSIRSLHTLETESYTGYLALGPDHSVAYIFTDTNDYELTFIKMSDEQITQTLASIAVQ